MLSWLKRRARVSINSRYVSLLLRRNLASSSSSNMFVAEPVQCIFNQTLKLVVLNSEGRDYSLEVPTEMTVERIKKMAVGHFFNPAEAVGGSLGEDRAVVDGFKSTTGNRTYRLVLVREARPLAETNSILLEKLLDNDELLLVERREPPPIQEPTVEETAAPTMAEINTATAQLPKQNDNRDPESSHHSVDFPIEFRRILVTMIEASVRLISADPASEEVFSQILDKLERRHRPRFDRNALRQLTEMGFPEAKATKALQVKRNVMEAMEWLLEQGSLEDTADDSIVGVNSGGGSQGENVAIDHATSASSTVKDYPQDPAERVLTTFLQYRKRWFQPNPQARQNLLQMGFQEEDVINALRLSSNKQNVACEILLNERPAVPDDQGLERDSPIISAILASPVIQLALPKPKTLLALMMLYESPNNANMWLSDPDTHPVVSQVLRIYHAEKHSLSQSRPPVSSGSAESSSSSSSSSSSETGLLRTLGRPCQPPRTNSNPSVNASMFPIRSDGQPYPQFPTIPVSLYSPISITMRNGSNGGVPSDQPSPYAGWLSSSSSSPLSLRRSSPNSTPIPTSRINASPNSSPIPTHLRLNAEEPMSHSGSPIRGTVGVRSATDGVTRDLPMTLVPPSAEGQSSVYNMPLDHYRHSTLTNIVNTDVEMDETGADSQDMETQ